MKFEFLWKISLLLINVFNAFLDISRELKYFHPSGHFLKIHFNGMNRGNIIYSQLIIRYLNDNYKVCFSIELKDNLS